MYICIYVYTYIRIYVYMYICIYVNMYMSVPCRQAVKKRKAVAPPTTAQPVLAKKIRLDPGVPHG